MPEVWVAKFSGELPETAIEVDFEPVKAGWADYRTGGEMVRFGLAISKLWMLMGDDDTPVLDENGNRQFYGEIAVTVTDGPDLVESITETEEGENG